MLVLDNGAIAKSVHGGLKREPGSINYEVYGTKGMMETERFDGARLTVYREGEQLCKGDPEHLCPGEIRFARSGGGQRRGRP